MATNNRWVALEGYKGIYEVSASGRVRSVSTGRILTVQRVGTDAARVRLSRNGVEKSVRVSTLVTLAKRVLGRTSTRNVTRSNRTRKTTARRSR